MILRILLLNLALLLTIVVGAQKNNKATDLNQLHPDVHVIHSSDLENHRGCMLFVNELKRDYQNHYNLDKARSRAKNGNGTPAVFDIQFNAFTPEAREGLQFAFDVISTLITSPVPIEVNANYEVLEEGSLGAAFTENVAVIDGKIVPSAIINKIAGVDVQFGAADGGQPVDEDIIIRINSTADWHFDPNNSADIGNKYDLSTVMMHEIIHGLGFSGGAFQRTSDGTYGLFQTSANEIFAYDSFVKDENGTSIKDIDAQGQEALAGALRGNKLFFRSPGLTEDQKIHAPLEWAPGTSYSHLDETTPLVDDLMTPFAMRGRVNQNPGVATQMLYDMGWDNTTLLYRAEAFYTEDLSSTITFNPEVFTDSGIDTSSFQMIYSQDSFMNDIRLAPVVFNGVSGQWEVSLPVTNSQEIYQYKFELIQNTGGLKRENPAPFLALESYTFAFVTDNIAPEITHTDIVSINSTDRSVSIKAFVSDTYVPERSSVTNSFAPLDTVYAEYRINDNPIQTVGMTLTEDGFGQFNLGAASISETISSADMFRYRIIARDSSLAKNESMYPSDGSFVSVPVIDVLDPLNTYTNDFNDLSEADFSMDRFSVGLVTGLDDGVLMNSDHTYQTAGANNTLSFTATLKNPIIIGADEAAAFIKFREIVLVEPGEPGANFGDTEFWDYVIIEAKKLSGGEWEPLLDGYDANAQAAWRTEYNRNIQFNNSTGVPNPNIFRSRELSFLGSNSPFVAMDTVLVRFRLFSDPAAAGWGWLIDNLNIQDANTNVAVEDFIEENQFLVYPNPSNSGMITVSASFTKAATNLRTELIDIHGRLIRSERIINGSQFYEQEMDISALPAGIYFMTLRDSESAITKKVVKY